MGRRPTRGNDVLKRARPIVAQLGVLSYFSAQLACELFLARGFIIVFCFPSISFTA
jgi:hypothetical protein